ncbi:MAG: hypothetical protein WAM26_11205 [Nitrososphaeraceae archaeon]
MDNRQKMAFIVGPIVGVVVVVIVYSVYQHTLLDENARLRQVRQEGILYDKHKQQCRDVASDLSVRIQKLVQQEANGSNPADFGSGVHAQRNALVAEASQLVNQCPYWIIEEVDKQIITFASSQ